MVSTLWIRRCGVALCSLSLVGSPMVSFAAPPGVIDAAPVAPAKDIALGPNGTLSGLVKDSSGQAKSAEIVTVGFSGNEVAKVQTLKDGRFTIEGLREGTHVVKASGSSFPVRFWQADKAPPSADSGITLVSRQVPAGDEIVLVPNDNQPIQYTPVQNAGGSRGGFFGRAFANYPLLSTAALLGAGIGTGVAIGTSSDSSPATP